MIVFHPGWKKWDSQREQAGFRKGRSTVDQVFILTEIIINRRPAKTYVAFLDVAKAYDPCGGMAFGQNSTMPV